MGLIDASGVIDRALAVLVIGGFGLIVWHGMKKKKGGKISDYVNFGGKTSLK